MPALVRLEMVLDILSLYNCSLIHMSWIIANQGHVSWAICDVREEALQENVMKDRKIPKLVE